MGRRAATIVLKHIPELEQVTAHNLKVGEATGRQHVLLQGKGAPYTTYNPLKGASR